MASIDIITRRPNEKGELVWVRLPSRDPETNLPTKAPRDARYRVRFRTPEGKSRTVTKGSRREAERVAAENEHKKATGEFVDASAGRAKFRDYANAWADRQPHRGTTAQSVRGILDTHVLPTFGDRPLGAIRPSEVQAWVSGLELAPSTVTVVYGKLAAIFRSAVDDRLIAHSPCGPRIIRLPRAHGDEVTPMTPAEVRAMVDAVPAHYRALVLLLAGTGLRPGEALGLTSDRVDWLRRTIRVDRQLITLAGEAPRLGPPKTPSSVRTVPAPDAVLEALSAHIAAFATITGGELSGLIFRDDKGDPIRRNALGHMWRRAARPAGVSGRTPHDLRHYAASVLIDSGASVKAVQRHLGHASAKTTLDTYAHLWPDAEDAARLALAAGLIGIVNDDTPASSAPTSTQHVSSI